MFDIRIELGTVQGLWPASFEDVTDRLIGIGSPPEIETSYGRNDELDEDDPGICSFVLDNTDGKWDIGIPKNTAVKVTLIVEGSPDVEHPWFYGVVETAPAMWPANGADAAVDVVATDALPLIALDEHALALDRQMSGDRITALLDVYGWPAGQRDLDPGVVRLEADGDPDEPVTINVREAIREAARSEDGQVYIDRAGQFVFRDRHARFDASPAVTFDMQAGLPYLNLSPTASMRLWTVARVEMEDGRVFEAEDPTGVSVFGRRVAPVRDLPVSGTEARAFAEWLVIRYGEERRRFATFRVDGTGSAALLSAALELVPGSLARVVHHPPSGATVDELVHIERVTTRMTRRRIFVDYELSPYFGEGPWFLWGDDVVDGSIWLDDVATTGGGKWAP